MSGAILNLVRVNPANQTAPDHDYTSGEIFERHEEISLVDPDGCPCAIPTPASFTDIDYKYGFITGAIGHQTRAILRDLSINIDYVESDKATRMEHWMQQRAWVMFSPNMGRNTVFSFRPVDITLNEFTSGGTATDLTGNHNLVYVDSSTMLHWDRVKRRFIKKSVDHSLPMHHTPGGAGIGSARSAGNLMVPSYPKSATVGSDPAASGWEKWGVDASQLTFTHNSGAFGHPDCPDTLTVAYTDDVTTARAIAVSGVFDPLDADYGGYTPTGSGTMAVCVWARGQLTDNCSLTLAGSTGTTTRDISGGRLDGWTPVFLSRYEADWSLSVPAVQLRLTSDDGAAGSIEIGPTMIAQTPSGRYHAGEYWAPSQSTSGAGSLQTVAAVVMPGQGSLHVSFFAPEWISEEVGPASFGVFSNDDFRLIINRMTDGLYYFYVSESGGGVESISTAASPITPGEVNTISYIWSGAGQRAFINGVFIGEVDRSTQEISFGANDSEIKIGQDTASNTMFPLVLLSLRIDEGAMTDTEVMNTHLALTDPTALQFARMTRGRVYQITGIPQTVRSSAGGSQIMGTLKLKQVDYQSWLADPLNKEESVL